jgi:hypothetical protein
MVFVHFVNVKWRLLSSSCIILGGVGAVLTLPTSVMFLGLVTLAMWVVYQKKPPVKLIIILLGGGIITLAYCLFNYKALNEAKSWGTTIKSIVDFCQFLFLTFETVLFSILLVPALIAIVVYKKRYLPFIGGIVILFISAIFTNGGPPRTYIPLTLLLIIAASEGCVFILEKIPAKYKVLTCLLIGILVVIDFQYQIKKWKFFDWYPVYQQTFQEPLNVIPIFSANNGYPITFNNKPYCYTDWIKRLLDNSSKKELLMFEPEGRINGMMKNGGEGVWIVKTKQKSIDYNGTVATRYTLEKITTPPKIGDVVIVIIRPAPKQVNTQILKLLATSKNELLALNNWFQVPIIRPENTYHYSVYAVKIVNDSNFDWNKFLAIGGGMIAGYKIVL